MTTLPKWLVTKIRAELRNRREDLIAEIDKFSKPKRGQSERRKQAASKKSEKRARTASVRLAVMARAGSFCECGCEAPFTEFNPATMDHFFAGSERIPSESAETCWALTVRCHKDRQANIPSARFWLERFVEHCKRHGFSAWRDGDLPVMDRYDAAADRARALLSKHEIKATLDGLRKAGAL